MLLSRFFKPVVLMGLIALLGACSLGNLKANLGKAVMNNDDLQLVGDALPTYMLMMDGVVKTWPEDPAALASAAKLYSAYSGIYVEDEKRAGKLSAKALSYALRAACADDDDFCHADEMPLDQFKTELADMDEDNLPILFTLGGAWAGWIQLHSNNWNAIAQLARVRLIMQRITEIKPSYNAGQAYMYLGILHSLLPAALGGQPDKAKKEFEQAIELSNGKNLLAKVYYAKQYARVTSNDELFNRLLQQVAKADPHAPGLTLQNVYAKELAKKLQQSTDF